ncbi:MAG: helix-turn-helix transcriptional regulator [bacterium]
MNPKQHENKRTATVAFGEILSKHRQAQKYSLRELEEICDVSASYISRLEKGEASASYEVIIRLAAAFGVEPSEFFAPSSGFKPSFREEFGPILESKTIQRMLRALVSLDPYAQRAIAVATTHWIELLKRGLHPVEQKPGIYSINESFVEEMEDFRGFKTP